MIIEVIEWVKEKPIVGATVASSLG